MRWIVTPFWLDFLFPSLIFRIKTQEPKIYLTFDDGPTPKVTDDVLNILKNHNALATFFCLGKQVENYPELYLKIQENGHAVGNHTYAHPNAFKVSGKVFLENYNQARQVIQSNLFRPPYGKITPFLIRKIKKESKIILFSVLAYDFDPLLSTEKCLNYLRKYCKPGSIVVLHDSLKCSKKMLEILPVFLNEFSKKGYKFEKINLY
ncbi:MAG: polysaccharide deacetylase family protein [Alphaproteobacteria bacterium]|nr:polysaccharide deacetylase family protein [Alphaproteobacteria bacterium]